MEKREKKKKDEEYSSKLTSPFARTAFRGSAETYLQNSSSGFPFSNSQIWKVSPYLYLMWTSQLTNWHLVAECRMHYHITMATIHHRALRVNWTWTGWVQVLLPRKCVSIGKNRIFRIRISFQKLNLRVTYSSPIKQMIYMGEKMSCPKDSW